jgi:hypothetical protein
MAIFAFAKHISISFRDNEHSTDRVGCSVGWSRRDNPRNVIE